MKAFTFLGTGDLHDCIYVYGDHQCQTRFFAEAVVDFFAPEQLVVLTTPTAAQRLVSENQQVERLVYLQQLLEGKTEILQVFIPDGSNQDQLWQVFDIIVGQVQAGDRLIFDITHGFRSLPFLTFMVLAYLRSVKPEVEIEKVIYGAYEAVDRDNSYKPVFDLTPFVGLLDWINSVNVFNSTGDARPMSQLLRQAQDQPYKLGLTGNLPTHLKNMSTVLQQISESLLVNRTLDAIRTAAPLDQVLSESEQDVGNWAQPFQVLMEQVGEQYLSLAMDEPENPGYRDQSLEKQYQQVAWYVKNGQYLQAITLAREWLISWVCWRLQRQEWLESSTREEVASYLNQESPPNQSGHNRISHLDGGEQCLLLWNRVNDLRNDLAHCGMRPDPRPAANSIQLVQRFLPQLEQFVENFLVPN